jgi:hypothetical protein
MHPNSSIFEGFELACSARHVFSRGQLAVGQAHPIAAAERGRSLHREVAGR